MHLAPLNIFLPLRYISVAPLPCATVHKHSQPRVSTETLPILPFFYLNPLFNINNL